MTFSSSAAAALDRIEVLGLRHLVPEELRAAALDRASRLFAYNIPIDRIRIEFDDDPARAPADRYMAKGLIEFGGPALLASVATDDAIKSLDFLIAKFDHLLRRRPR